MSDINLDDDFFRLLTARHLRSLVEQLKHPDRAPAVVVAEAPPIKEPILPPAPAAPRPRPLAELDTSKADMIGRGIVFPQVGDGSDHDWCVLAELDVDPGKQSGVFEFVAKIKGNAATKAIVEQSYLLLLERPVDDEGQDIYVARLNNHTLSRRVFFTDLLASDEGLRLKRRLILIPQPSSWLDQLVSPETKGSSFPRMKLKV